MGSENKSPSYLAEREAVRRWLQKSPDGKLAVEHLKRQNGGSVPYLDDDQFVDWEALVAEYRGAVVHSANCREAREAFTLAAQSSTGMAPPGKAHAKWRKFFSAPMGYVLRREIVTADPDYWKDPVNVHREALQHPEWCCVPPEVIRGELNKHLGSMKREGTPNG